MWLSLGLFVFRVRVDNSSGLDPRSITLAVIFERHSKIALKTENFLRSTSDELVYL